MERYKEAYEDYKKGLKYREIADKYGVSESTVRSWKNRKWEKNNCKNVATDNKTLQQKDYALQQEQQKKRGAPVGNKNNYKHGLFSKLSINNLTDEEYEYILNGNLDTLKELELMTKVDNVQIKRFYERMSELSNAKNKLVLSGLSKTTEKNKSGEVYKDSTTTNMSSSDDMVIKYITAIERIERKKIKCLELINEINNGNKNVSMDDNTITINIGDDVF